MERMTKFRVGVFLALVALMLVFFGLRAYDVQVVNAPRQLQPHYQRLRAL